MKEADEGPGESSTATKNGEKYKPAEEENEDVASPHSRVRKPLCVFVQIRRRHCSNVEVRHAFWFCITA